LKQNNVPQVKASNNSTSTTKTSNNGQKATKSTISNFPQRLSALKKSNPLVFQNTAQVMRKNYK
jgi:hypothetical protein